MAGPHFVSTAPNVDKSSPLPPPPPPSSDSIAQNSRFRDERVSAQPTDRQKQKTFEIILFLPVVVVAVVCGAVRIESLSSPSSKKDPIKMKLLSKYRRSQGGPQGARPPLPPD